MAYDKIKQFAYYATSIAISIALSKFIFIWQRRFFAANPAAHKFFITVFIIVAPLVLLTLVLYFGIKSLLAFRQGMRDAMNLRRAKQKIPRT